MPSKRVLLALGLALTLAACSTPRTRDPAYHHVLPGDTLYSIAFSYGLDYRDIARWNDIGPAYAIFAGQRLSLLAPEHQRYDPRDYYARPVEDKSIGAWTPDGNGDRGGTRPSVPVPPTPLPAKPAPVAAASPMARPAPATASPLPASPAPKPAVATLAVPVRTTPVSVPPPASLKADGQPTRWLWPAEGPIVARFAPANGKKGIDIGGRAGQPVAASAAGVVVYSGNGLLGYGNLVIVKHSDSYLSAYGHNRNLLVREGESVSAGQKIAEIGQNGKSVSILHFEIRKDGKPVDPARYLPRRN